jgi:hypothetical protein
LPLSVYYHVHLQYSTPIQSIRRGSNIPRGYRVYMY